LLDQDCEFVPRPLDNPLQFGHELGIESVVRCLECFERLIAAADEDAEQRDLLLNDVCRDENGLPRYAAAETSRALARDQAEAGSI
jgi:hypothetical protein